MSPCRGDVRGSICVAKAALAPGFDVDRPPTPERLAPVTFRPRRRSSNMRRSPIWTARAHLRNRAETGRLRLHHGLQDKSAGGSPAHVADRIRVLPHFASLRCWRFIAIPKRIQSSKGRQRSNCARL
jgi:hypothetical protein